MSEAHVDTADRRASDGKSAVDVEKETITQESTRDSRGIVPEDIIKHSHDADEALKAFEAHRGHSIEIDEATSKRLLRKIDWNMMPLLCIVYGLNYLDKTTLSYASVLGIQSAKSQGGIGLVGTQYNWLGSMFYFGYLAWEYPTSWLLQRLPLGKYSAFNVIVWGSVLTCFAAVGNFAGAMGVRFLLGMFEAAVTPGWALYTSMFYTKHEQGMRVNMWFSFNGFAQILGGVVAYGIAKGVEAHGSTIEPWKIVFLATGLLTVAMGVIFLFWMPDNQMNARFLSKEDRILAIERVRVNQQGIGNKTWKAYQFKEALTDPLTWAFFLFSLIGNIPNGGLSNFFSLLIKSFGYTSQQSLLYGTPGGAVEIVALWISGFMGDKTGQRLFTSSIFVLIAMIGMIMVIAIPAEAPAGRLIGYYLTLACPAGFVAILSLISTNVAGYTKKTTVAALYLIAYCVVGNIIGPQLFDPDDYVPAEITIVVCWGVCLGFLAFVWWYCRWQNAKKAARRAEAGYVKLENQEWLDLTDRENPEFVYTL